MFETGIVFPASWRKHGQIAHLPAVHPTEELDAYVAIVPKHRRFQTVQWKTTYVSRLIKTGDNATVANNSHKCYCATE